MRRHGGGSGRGRVLPCTWRFTLQAVLFVGAWGALGAQATATTVTPARLAARSCRDTLPTAPAAMSGPTPPLRWHDGPVRWAEWSVHLGASRVPVTVVVVQIDPTRVALSLDIAREGSALGSWSIAKAPDSAVVAFNAGQFTDAGPWGWVVHRGREWQAPGVGSLAASVLVDRAGYVRIVSAESALPWLQGEARSAVVEAIQSYPHLLDRGHLPAALCRVGAINRTHRDIRLALGVRRDGHVLLALTRYAPPAMVPDAASRLPIGPTTLEMAEVMHRLGAEHAVMLDGGLSAQLRVGSRTDGRSWPGLRDVPLAFVGYLR